MARRSSFALAGALLLVALILLSPQPEGLPPAGKRTGALFAACVLLWATEAIPIGVTALLAIALQPILQVADPRTAFGGMASPVFFFVLAMFCIAGAITGSKLDRRFAFYLLDRAGGSSHRVVIAIMVGTTALSTIMSDVPACAVFMAIGVGVLERLRVEPRASAMGKAVMIGIPIAALIGGVATPAGSSINILGIHFIEQYGKVRVSFLEWMAIGIPMVMLLTPLACWAVLRAYPPEIETLGHDFRRERKLLGPMSLAEKKALGLLAIMMALWIGSSWHPGIDVTVVALAGSIVMFLPGVRLLDWTAANRAIGWDVMLMIGGVTSIGQASVDTGLAQWLVDSLLGGMEHWPLLALLAAISTFTVLVHLALPVGPVINAVVIPPIALMAVAAGANPALFALPVAFTASCGFLLPLDPVALVTYSRGYYRMLDMAVPGIPLSLAWIVVMTAIMLLLGPPLGFF
jgi:sodium-dependent dicarboxylate transporter 2/3/5